MAPASTGTRRTSGGGDRGSPANLGRFEGGSGRGSRVFAVRQRRERFPGGALPGSGSGPPVVHGPEPVGRGGARPGRDRLPLRGGPESRRADAVGGAGLEERE